jgi:hypothetical protein
LHALAGGGYLTVLVGVFVAAADIERDRVAGVAGDRRQVPAAGAAAMW